MNQKSSKVESKDSKGPQKSAASYGDVSKYCPSVFTLTFVIEVIGIDVWHDCNEGWLDLGPSIQGVKLAYQLYPGQNFEVDVQIWPHVAKVTCKSNYEWVRTWQFLERRWLTFSLAHVFPVRVADLRTFVATVTPSTGFGAKYESDFSLTDEKIKEVVKWTCIYRMLGSNEGLALWKSVAIQNYKQNQSRRLPKLNAKTEKPAEVYLPPLQFAERRQFAEVIESETPLWTYIENMIWSLVLYHIPRSFMDGPFDKPETVKDVRHQNAVLTAVQDVVLNKWSVEEEEEEIKVTNSKLKKAVSKEIKKKPPEKVKYEVKLSGDWILAGIGRVTPFVTTGDRPTDLGEVLGFISTVNLPAQDDLPVFFVNVGNLTDVPIENFKENRLTHIYTRWTINEEVHNSEQHSLETKPPKADVDFNDHHSLPLPSAAASDVMAIFLDEPFHLEVRGIRIPQSLYEKSLFFGYDKGDLRYGVGLPPPLPNQEVDILIAQTRIDARALTKINGFVRGEFPLYPPQPTVVPLEREGICTNDINAVRSTVKPDLFIQPGVILEAQMSIEVSMGLVGCKPKPESVRYSRLYCLISDNNAIMTLLRQITEINESVLQTGRKADLLTGFALDTGDTVMLYVEGPKEGQILRLWERTEDFYPNVNPVFSTSSKYSCRLYPELLLAAMPFNVMKMIVPLSVLLGVTPIYARPALPLPTRSAVLKVGRLIARNFKTAPCCGEMPTAMELKSFRLELCAAPRPPNVFMSDIPRITPVSSWDHGKPTVQSATKINWKPKGPK